MAIAVCCAAAPVCALELAELLDEVGAVDAEEADALDELEEPGSAREPEGEDEEVGGLVLEEVPGSVVGGAAAEDDDDDEFAEGVVVAEPVTSGRI